MKNKLTAPSPSKSKNDNKSLTHNTKNNKKREK